MIPNQIDICNQFVIPSTLEANMTLDEVKKYFGTCYRFNKETGMAHDNFRQWGKRGYIPFMSQHRIEIATRGNLKADFKDVGDNIVDKRSD
jgi:hypothetical protein